MSGKIEFRVGKKTPCIASWMNVSRVDEPQEIDGESDEQEPEHDERHARRR